MMADDVADTEEALAEFDFLMPGDKASATRPPTNQGTNHVLSVSVIKYYDTCVSIFHENIIGVFFKEIVWYFYGIT